MARTLRLTKSITYVDGSTTLITVPAVTDSITQTNPEVKFISTSVTTTEGTVSLGLTTNGEIIIYNRDATNYIEVGTTTTDYPIRIKAGRSAGPFMLNAGKELKLKANTATCKVDIYAWGD
jgi:hypothetical protein